MKRLELNILRAGVLLLLVLTGCMSLPAGLSAPTHFYRLEVPSHPASDSAASAQPSVARVLVKVQVTDSLLGRFMIVARSDYELHYQDTERWAEPISHGLSRLIAAELSPYYAAAESTPTSSGFSPDYRVEVTVDKLWGTAKGEVVLSAHWSVNDSRDNPIVFGRREITQKGWDTGDYKDLAVRISRMSADLSLAINDSLAEAAQKK
jgi:uncharacterized lipoprotein YmbA